MGKRAKKVLTGFLVVVLTVASHPLWMPLFGKFLVVKNDIQKADVIMVLSGDWKFDREKKAIELYKEGFADKIIRVLERENISFDMMKRLLNSEATQEQAYTNFFESNGVNKESIILLDEAVATSTFDELKAARAIILKDHFKSMILVTSDYHMRRALMTAKWVFRHEGITIYHATVYSASFNPDNWWLHERGIKEVVFEYLDSGFYLIYHFMLGK